LELNFEFDNNIQKFLKIIIKNALIQNIRVFFVGGIVRDNILNKPLKDIDLIVEGNAIEFCNNIGDEVQIKSTHKDFGTVKLNYKGFDIDIASTRCENYPFSGCLPVVDKIGVRIEKDVLRRDFTINALYCELGLKNNKITYNLIDFIDGINDIKTKKLKVLHNNSYIDDPTRIIRGVNFKNRFNFEFDKQDKALIDSYMKNINYQNASYNRILDVFKHVLSNEMYIENFKKIIDKKYYKILKNNFSDINFDEVMRISQIFKLNEFETIEFFKILLEDSDIERMNSKTNIDIYKDFEKFNPVELAYYFIKTNDDNAISFLNLKDIKLKLSGKILQTLKYPKGKLYGKIFDSLLAEKLENKEKFLTLEDEINWVKINFPI